MTGLTLAFTLISAIFLLRAPRVWAPLPMLIGAGYITTNQALEIGGLNFTVIRILVAVGVLRVMMRGERISGGLNPLDKAMVVWAGWGALTSFFYSDFMSALVTRLALVYDCLGFYLLLRIFIQDSRDILTVAKVMIIVLMPLAMEMMSERVTGRNMFAYFGGVSEEAVVRLGKVRAQGPFGHPILAGTVGAVCWPFALMFWKENRKLALLGLAATGMMVLSSGSSGPIMTVVFTTCALWLWKMRDKMRAIRWACLWTIIGLDIVMEAPVYYLLARIDLTGSSTGWHRAELIHAAFQHIGEWWFSGTDYTRHWMPYGVPWSPNHTDITNHYIKMGVIGGLPLMGLFIWTLVAAYGLVGRALDQFKKSPVADQYRVWILGAMLFGHTATWMSVSYFDQSIVFLYLLLAAISAIASHAVKIVPTNQPATISTQPNHAEGLSHHR